MLKVSTLGDAGCIQLYVVIDIAKFKESFVAAQKYNLLLKEGKTEELVEAPVVEDVEEVLADDPDKNTTADPDAGEEQE